MELQAGPEAAGERLDSFLAGPLGSRARAQRLIDAGAVLVDGEDVPKRHRMSPGEMVVVDAARGHWHGTLAQALEGRAAGGEDAYRAGIVHRLDRDTSGLLVVAKS